MEFIRRFLSLVKYVTFLCGRKKNLALNSRISTSICLVLVHHNQEKNIIKSLESTIIRKPL